MNFKLALLLLASLFQMEISQAQSLPDYSIEEMVQYGSHQIEAQCHGDTSKPYLLLIHGSPGSWGAWKTIISQPGVLDSFCVVTYNRPGYKGTTVPATGDLQEQAAVAYAVMQHFATSSTYTLAGHSYGGAVVAQLLLDYPEACSKGVFVAATLAPALQQPKWYNKLGKIWPVKGLLSPQLRSSNTEMMGLGDALLKNESRLSAISQPIVLIQGERDILVPFETAAYFRQHKSEGVKFVLEPKMNHFVPWSHPELVVDALLKL